jgi:hypothetical protein
MEAFQHDDVCNVFKAYPEEYRKPLLCLRALIFEVAGVTNGVGRISETLKWGQPSYLTEESGAGTTVRLDRFGDGHVAIFFHCQTSLVDTFRTLFPTLTYSKNRAILISITDDLPLEALRFCIELALTYKLRKKTAR